MIETIALVVLALTNIATLAYHAWYVYLESKNKNKLINSLVAKSSQDFSNFEFTDKMKEAPKVEPLLDDAFLKDHTPVEELDDEEFDSKVIKS